MEHTSRIEDLLEEMLIEMDQNNIAINALRKNALLMRNLAFDVTKVRISDNRKTAMFNQRLETARSCLTTVKEEWKAVREERVRIGKEKEKLSETLRSETQRVNETLNNQLALSGAVKTMLEKRADYRNQVAGIHSKRAVAGKPCSAQGSAIRITLPLSEISPHNADDTVHSEIEDPTLPYCAKKEIRRTQESVPLDIVDEFGRKFEPRTSYDEIEGFLPQSTRENSAEKEGFVEQKFELLDSVDDTTPAPTTPKPYKRWKATPYPRARQNILYTIFPNLQKNHEAGSYCPSNQYTFQVTCTPQKKLRYDLQIFCQEYADICGVPNTNLFPSRTGRGDDDGRPKGYGQKQKSGNFGLGRSFAFGLGVIPGFEVVSSQGTDIGKENLPGLNQIGGIMLNNGVDMGVTGRKTGKGPSRTIDALDRGFAMAKFFRYPSIGGILGQGEPSAADRRATAETLKSFGIPNVAGLGKILGGLSGRPRNGGSPRVPGYEPGFGAVNKKAPLALGKVDREAVNLPAGLGDINIDKGNGFGLGK